MSLFGAMNTAVSGLNAQSNAFGNISDNVANSQTTGFKRVDTNFVDFLTTSTASNNDPGAVVARPDYVNNVQGTMTQTDNPLGLAIAGQGFFSVSRENGQVGNATTFNPQGFYTRAGDFQLNKSGYMVNSAGEFLNGWSVDPNTRLVDRNNVAPIQVSQTVFDPVATSTVTLSANLPATPAAGVPISSQIDVFDALGNSQTLKLDWTQTVPGTPNDWTVTITSTTGPNPGDIGTAQVLFGPNANGVSAGTIGDLQNATNGSVGTITIPNPFTAGVTTAADLTLSTDFGNGVQPITLKLGDYGLPNGLTQYAGTQYNLRGLTQDGVAPGSFSSVSTQANGNIVVNYDNGQSRTIAQVPLITFNSPNALQRQDGQSFTATSGSGSPLAEEASTNGAGNLVVSSIESSNVDIASEFSKLIVAQQAYTANAKMVTTTQQLLTITIDMKQ